MTIKALIFDFDGTIADTEEAHRQAFNAAFLEHDLHWHWSAHQYAELLAVSGGKERIARYLETLSLPEAEKTRLGHIVPLVHRTKARVFAELMESWKAPLRPGVARLLREARAAGVRLAIASTTTRSNVESLLSTTLGAGTPQWFDVIACGDIVAHKKPAPDIYLLALSSLRLPASSCVALEDSAKGLAAAKGAGLPVIVTPTFWTTSDDFTGAEVVLPGFGDPDAPLDLVSAKRVGAPYVGLAEIARLVGAPPRVAA